MRITAVLATGVAVAALLSGCGSPAAGPAEVEQAFLDALGSGDGAAALALTTFDAGSTDCTDLLERYGDLTTGIAAASVGEVSVDGDTASVGYAYTVPDTSVAVDDQQEIVGTHTLVRDGGEWLVELPESYRLNLAVPADTVGEVGVLEKGSIDDRVCTGSTIDAPAFPGSYDVSVTDPSAVFEGRFISSVRVDGDTDPGTAVIPTYLSDEARGFVETQVETRLFDNVVSVCIVSDFTAEECPHGLPSTGIGIAPQLRDRLTGSVEVEAIWSVDGSTWRFSASGASYLYTLDGVAQVFPIVFMGTVSNDGTDYILTLD